MNPLGEYWLPGYSVNVKRGEIRLRAEWMYPDLPAGMPRESELTFQGVEAYHLAHDNLSTILGCVVVRPLEQFVKQHEAEFSAGFARAGWPHFWRGSVSEAVTYLLSKQQRAFEIVSTVGPTGWILAAGTDAAVTPG